MKTLTVLFLLFASMFVHAQEYAIRQLEDSPRHHEWVVVKSNGRNLHCFVAYPEIAEKAPVVIVIHENRGLNDWARSLTDQLAAAGYLAIAPDLLSGASREYEKTKDYPTTDAAREAIYRLDADAVTADLDAVFAYAKTINAGNGKIHVMGFCWGGSQSFRFATNNSGLTAAFVFYGTGPN
ncbi:MAG: dienelactone hydrolase family protein, partial [Cyclobacteriaceae bacterium]|nr:dienelactone hydrolase family protein [Cyclobacteriaceae bacterium]